MKKKTHVAISALTNRIYAGTILKDGQTWASDKTDVTGECMASVCMHVLAAGGVTVVTADGKPEWEICVFNASGKSELTDHTTPAHPAPSHEGVVVPRIPIEATDEMAESVKNVVSDYAAKKIWRQMLKAAAPLYVAECLAAAPAATKEGES